MCARSSRIERLSVPLARAKGRAPKGRRVALRSPFPSLFAPLLRPLYASPFTIPTLERPLCVPLPSSLGSPRHHTTPYHTTPYHTTPHHARLSFSCLRESCISIFLRLVRRSFVRSFSSCSLPPPRSIPSSFRKPGGRAGANPFYETHEHLARKYLTL